MKTITVAKGLCSPARSAIMKTLTPYGIKIHGISEYDGGELKQYMQCADVTVNDRAAAWVEYLLMRSGRFQLLSKPIDARNEQWALKWDKRMPQPWVEAGCDAKGVAAKAAAVVTKPVERVARQAARRITRKERKERY